MKKNFFSLLIIFILTISGVNLFFPQSASSHIVEEISVYSLTYNRHGRVAKTSVGTFYIGKSGDVILRASSGRKFYGYWEQKSSTTYVYIGDDVYYFSF